MVPSFALATEHNGQNAAVLFCFLMAKKPQQQKGRTTRKRRPIQPSLPHVPEREDDPPLEKDPAASGTRAAEMAALGALLITAAQWLNSGEGKESTGAQSSNDAIAIFLFLVGALLFIPIIVRVVKSLRSRSPRTYGYFFGAVAMVLLGRSIGVYTAGRPTNDPPFPRANVYSHEPQVRSGVPVVAKGKVSAFDLAVTNKGPEFARDVTWNVGIRLVPTPVSRAAEKSMVDEIAGDVSMRARKDMPPGDTSWNTHGLQFKDEDIDAIASETKRLYFLYRSEWVDPSGAHKAEKCVYLQPPGTNPIWRNCASHNDID